MDRYDHLLKYIMILICFILIGLASDLHRAVFDGELRTVKDILKVLSEPDFRGSIDVNGRDKAGLTPLVLTDLTRVCAFSGRDSLWPFLFEQLLAVRKPNARVVKELLDHGADPAITDRREWNSLHHALHRKRRYCYRCQRIQSSLTLSAN
jgi:hypothetical protein